MKTNDEKNKMQKQGNVNETRVPDEIQKWIEDCVNARMWNNLQKSFRNKK